MRYKTETSWKPGSTPKTISYLIAITAIISAGCGLIQNIYSYFFGFPGPQDLLTLSWWGLGQYYFWQPLTYLFVQDLSLQGITLGFMITLLFEMYILWVMGSIVYEHLNKRAFLLFYFLSGMIAGLLALLMSLAEGSTVTLAGPIASLMAILTLWTMLHPESEVYLFFFIPLKAKWLLAGVLGTMLLISFSQVNFVYVVLYLVGALSGYFYGILGKNLRGPFIAWHDFEDRLTDTFIKLQNFFLRQHKIVPKSKIYDFDSGENLDSDEKFIDAMLEKISKQGEKSLSWNERRRMQKISERKSKR